MTPKCPNCKRDQDDCVCVDEIEYLRAQVAEIKEGMAYRNSLVGRLEAERDELKRQRDEYKADAGRLDYLQQGVTIDLVGKELLFRVGGILPSMRANIREAIDAALAATKGES